MSKVLAFDIYGTLIDVQGLVPMLEDMVGDKSVSFSALWREKQLEYSFRRGLMGAYETFSVCTQAALEYSCQYFETPLTQQQKQSLLKAYASLPAFSDVIEALSLLKNTGFKLYAFSNGTEVAVDKLLHHAGIRSLFEAIISVDELKTFKPSPNVYQYFLDKSGADKDATWLISSNPFDLIGGLSFGLKTVWVKRSASALFDPWGYTPTKTIHSLSELETSLLNA